MVTFSIPAITGQLKSVSVNAGTALFVIGANGSGKSSLLQQLFIQHKGNAKRVAAHRQTWFPSNALEFTPSSRKEADRRLNSADTEDGARWTDTYGYERCSAAIFDLINAENTRSRRIAEKIDAGALEAALEADKEKHTPLVVEEALNVKKADAPIKVLNELLKVSNLSIQIFIENNEEIFAKKPSGTPYSIAELSDGERNAILIGANVLTASPGMIVIIDEPERHLHRSIISPLLSTLFRKRSDCVFVISTHDVELAMDNSDASILLVRSCTLGLGLDNRWDTDLLAPNSIIREEVKRSILGARRTVLFVEGDAKSSLDMQIYEIVFPSISIVPKGTALDVEQATKGIRATESLNWIEAYGLVDADDRTPDELRKLEQHGIYALKSYAVESLYYHPHIVARVAQKQAEVTGEDGGKIKEDAMTAALRSIEHHKARLCARVTEKKVKQQIFRTLPDYKYIAKNSTFASKVDLSEFLAREREEFDKLVTANDVSGLMARYPVRETEALDRISASAGFQEEGEVRDGRAKSSG